MIKNQFFLTIFVLSSLVWQVPVGAQTVEGDILRGQGAFARGAGWYNFYTARANAINVSAMRNYNEEVRTNYRNRVLFWAEKKAGRKLSKEEAARKADERITQLRNAPTGDDINSGDALNVLVDILTDPNVKQQDWYMKSNPLPEAATVKDMVFDYYPNGNSSPNAYKVEIAISRLGKNVNWPIYMQNDAFRTECANYENTIVKLRDGIQHGKVELVEFSNLDKNLESLKGKVRNTLDDKRGFKREGLEFTKKLEDASHLFDAKNVEYGQELLQETAKYDATTVGELVAFMLKYRLLFAEAESPSSTRLYSDLYTVMKKQASALGVNPRDMSAANAPQIDRGPRLFAVNSVWVSDNEIRIFVTERTRNGFEAVMKSRDGKVERKIKGTINEGKISWLAKDTEYVKGPNAPIDHEGNLDFQGKTIKGSWRGPKGRTGSFTYRLKE